MPKTLEETLAAALAEKQAATAEVQAKNVTVADLGSILGEFKVSLMPEIEEAVKKAFPAAPQGSGRRGVLSDTSTDERDNDPAAYLVKKAASPNPDWDQVDKELIGKLTVRALLEGLE